jgi:hypothetical protein
MSGPAYIAGDFWRICDRCGFKVRSSETSRTWDGLYVCREDFETRHPQDFVRGRKDDQSVPDPRPEPVDNVIGPLTTTLTADAAAGDVVLNVSSSVRFQASDRVGVMLSDGNIAQRVLHSVPSATSIRLTEALGGSATSGGVVIDYTAVSSPDIG